ncbi:MAG: VOC family protein [Planctomycetota bacterium]
MAQNPPEGYQRVIPYLLYEDAPAALAFLRDAFGFEEKFRFEGKDNGIGHAEMAYQDNVIMLATVVLDAEHASPKKLRARHSMVMVYVDDVDAHYARAKAAGAKITRKLADQFYGDRTYGAEDPEGHAWYFATHMKDVPPEDLQPPE